MNIGHQEKCFEIYANIRQHLVFVHEVSEM